MYKLLSKNTCYDESKDCNGNALIHIWNYINLIQLLMPLIRRRREKRKLNNIKIVVQVRRSIQCCDPSDTNLPYLDKYIEQDLKDKYPYVKLNREKINLNQ